jgi:sec-independent protein translocase protein TatB
MLGLGVGEVIIILVVALVVLRPTKLPQVARQVGKGLREFRRHASDLQHTFDEVAREAEREERDRERKAAIGMAPPEHLPVAANEPLAVEAVPPPATATQPVEAAAPVTPEAVTPEPKT